MSLRVILPYAKIDPRCAAALANVPVEAVEMRGEEDYYWLLHRLWREGESFLLIEHDVVIHDQVVPTVATCGHAWCGYPYTVIGYFGTFLGCTHFGAQLMRWYPTLMDVVATRNLPGTRNDQENNKRFWAHLDVRMISALREAGYIQEQHYPPVQHAGRHVTIPHACTNGAPCQCAFPGFPHGCPRWVPDHPGMVAHYCDLETLPRNIDVYDMSGTVISPADPARVDTRPTRYGNLQPAA